MFFYLITTFSVIFFLAGIFFLILYSKGVRFFKSREQQETEAGLHKAFGKDNKWGYPGSAEHDFRDHTDHSHHSDGGGGDGSGSSD
jgi:hypothetical protein